MKTSELIKLLGTFLPSSPVKVSIDGELNPIGKVYHEPSNTFIQAGNGGEIATVFDLIERLNAIDKSVPFDASVVSGDDWNYMVVQGVSTVGEALVISLSEPVFG
ncbi:hypothetical protein [Shewanella sp. UCD-KL12]|uniref:hypothetical protein n=1 Tax=Shewanella sp. UCD-KL12 TaxID=1917163 RepID=UPI00097038D4|nr:hypothetical protein [Shewanella sp. UCD-KL12]